MPLEKLKARMQANASFEEYWVGYQDENKEPVTDALLLRAYQSWILETLSFIDSGAEVDEIVGGKDAVTIAMGAECKPFLDYLKARNSQLYERESRYWTNMDNMLMMPKSSSEWFVRSFAQWLRNELDDVLVAVEVMGVDKVLEYDRRRALESRFEDMFKKELAVSKDAGLNFQRATQAKELAKANVKNFLSATSPKPVTKFNRALLGKADKTSSGIELLRQEMARCDARMGELVKALDKVVLQGPKRKFIQEQIQFLQTRKIEAQNYIEQLEQSKQLKKTTRQEWEKGTQQAKVVLDATDQEFNRMTRDLMKGVRTVKQTLTDLEPQIAQKKKELEDLIDRIPAIHSEKMTAEETLKALEAKSRGERPVQPQEGTSGEPDALHRSVADRLAAKAKDMGKIKTTDETNLAGRIKATQEALAEITARLEATEKQHQDVFMELAFLDAKYNAIRNAAEESLHHQQRLVKLSDAAKDELAWLKKLGKVDKAMNVYCSTWSVSYELLLQIGKLAAGDACGTAGMAVLSLMGAASGFQKNLFAGCMSTAATGLLLSSIHAYDTGSFGISLKLGISWGTDFTLATKDKLAAKVGLALVYTASMSVDDDRRFRTVCTLTLMVTGEASIPGVLTAGLEFELIKTETAMTYRDVHHWAAWLGQKWANARAWVVAVSVYENRDKFDQPTARDLERMREVAEISMMNDPQLKDMLSKVCQYMSEPITRMENTEILAGMKAGVGAANFFGVGVSLRRTGEPRYFRRVSDARTGEVWEYFKDGRQISGGGSITAGLQVQCSYSQVQADANTDNVGEYLTFTVSFPLLDQNATWIGQPHQEIAGGSITNWIQNNLVPVADKIQNVVSPSVLNLFQGPFSQSSFMQLATSVSLGTFTISLGKSTVGNKTKWVLYYWRPVFSTETSLNMSIPIGYGFNIDLGGSLTLSRTYREQLGTNTIGYLNTVYHGFMNISPPERDPNTDPRPQDARGDALWNNWLDAHKTKVWTMLSNIARDQWITGEVNALKGGPELITALKGQKSLKEGKSFDIKTWVDGKKALMTFLAGGWKPYLEDQHEGWQKVEVPFVKYNWSINPYMLAKEYQEAKAGIKYLDPRLKPAVTILGDRKGLIEQIHQDVRWIPDDQVRNCPLCGVKFSRLGAWKHHCRNCGGIFCDKCSIHTLPLPQRGYKDKVRVCNPCYARLTQPPVQSVSQGAGHAPGPGSGHQPDPHAGHQPDPHAGQQPDPHAGQQPDPHAQHPPSQKGSLLKIGSKQDVSESFDPKQFDVFASKPKDGVSLEQKPDQPVKPAHDPKKITVDQDGNYIVPGFTEIKVSGDGNCLFRAVAVGMGGYDQARQADHLQFREQAVDHMRTHKQRFSDLDEFINDAYLDTMRVAAKDASEQDHWGGGPELEALSRVLRRPLILHSKDFPPWTFEEDTDVQFKPEQGSQPIHLLYKGRNHYSCLQPV